MKHISLLLVACIMLLHAVAQTKDVDANTFQKEISTNASVQILDVRTPGEYQNGHIKNAMLADWTNQIEFKDRVQYLDKTKPVLVYCASGGRSSKAAKWLADNGFISVENLTGGFTQWKIENKPVEGAGTEKQITIEEYNKSTMSSGIVLIDFGAEWCPPCRKMQPVLDALQKDLKGKFNLVKVDGGINTNVMQQLKVNALPTFIIYKNGKEVWRKQGIVEKAEFEKIIKG